MDLRFNNEVNIVLEKVMLEGELVLPREADSIVIFSHDSGSSRFSPRNKMVAQRLNSAGIGTLLLDLLSQEEDLDYSTRFDIELLTERLVGATEWLEKFEAAENCRMGYFGASTGAASALKAAAYLPQTRAVMSRGGRPDLAMEILHKVKAQLFLLLAVLIMMFYN